MIKQRTRLIYAVLCDKRTCPFDDPVVRMFIGRPLGSYRSISILIITYSRLAIVRAYTMVGRHLSTIYSRILTIAICQVIRFVLGLIRTVRSSLPFFRAGIRYLIYLMKGRQVFARCPPREYVPRRIKVRRGRMTV